MIQRFRKMCLAWQACLCIVVIVILVARSLDVNKKHKPSLRLHHWVVALLHCDKHAPREIFANESNICSTLTCMIVLRVLSSSSSTGYSAISYWHCVANAIVHVDGNCEHPKTTTFQRSFIEQARQKIAVIPFTGIS